MTARISIAMATYNGARYLQEQLDSFLYQTQQPDELVVCDDGSTDGTLEILESFRQQVPFTVRVYRNETNLGYIRNFEKALSLCTGDIIFLSDQDDVWFCNKVETMAATLAAWQDIFVLQADMVLADEDLNPTAYTQLGNIIALGHSPDTYLTGCGTAIRRAWLDLALPIPAELAAHDNWIHRLALALGVRMLLKAPLQYYRRHGDNVSNWLASRPARLTGLDTLRDSGLRDATAAWRSELARVKATRSRLAASAEALRKLGLSSRQTAAILALDRHMEALDNRIEMMTVPRVRRLPRVLAMWMRGGYRHFAGWKSAAKDILRP